jgi:putative oxidoreductase
MESKNLKKALLALRLGVFIVMFMWTLDKFVNPNHAAAVFSKYYMIEGLSVSIAYFVGALQMILVFCFLLGVKKKWSYGAILIMHTISTLSAFAMYLNPWGPKNLLFFAAWPMLAAIYALFVLREEDSLLTI